MEILEKMVKSYDLYKNHSYVDRVMKEGEIQGYKDLLKIYSAVDEVEDKDIKLIISILQSTMKKAESELYELKARENIFTVLDRDLENNLNSLDVDKILKDNKSNKKYPIKIQNRIKRGVCSLNRPGKGGFVCNDPIVKGSQYCKEHTLKYDKILAAELSL